MNAAAAAISVDTALYGSVAAFWIAGLRACTADMPGACVASIGNGAAGSALAVPVIPNSSAADEPTAMAALANSFLVGDMVLPRLEGVWTSSVVTARR